MQTLLRNWHAPRLCSHATMCSCSLSVLSPKTVLGGLNSHFNNDNDTLINSAVLSLLSPQCKNITVMQVLFLSSSSVSELWLLQSVRYDHVGQKTFHGHTLCLIGIWKYGSKAGAGVYFLSRLPRLLQSKPEYNNKFCCHFFVYFSVLSSVL